MKNLVILLAVATILSGCEDGRVGPDGARGKKGRVGNDGSSCTVLSAINGAVITCEDGTTTAIVNGADGADGTSATPTAYSVAEIIKPCPGPGHREVLLKLYNGDILAHYSHGSKQFLTLLTPGNYQLTDGSGCNFTVHPDLTVTW